MPAFQQLLTSEPPAVAPLPLHKSIFASPITNVNPWSLSSTIRNPTRSQSPTNASIAPPRVSSFAPQIANYYPWPLSNVRNQSVPVTSSEHKLRDLLQRPRTAHQPRPQKPLPPLPPIPSMPFTFAPPHCVAPVTALPKALNTEMAAANRVLSAHPEEQNRVELAPLARRCTHCWAEHFATALIPSAHVALGLPEVSRDVDANLRQQMTFCVLNDLSDRTHVERLNRSIQIPVAHAADSVNLEEEVKQSLTGIDVRVIRHTLETIRAYEAEREVGAAETSLVYPQDEQLRWKKSFEGLWRMQRSATTAIEKELKQREDNSTYDDGDLVVRLDNHGKESGIRAIANTATVTGGVRACPVYHSHVRVSLPHNTWFWEGSKTGEEELTAHRRGPTLSAHRRRSRG